MHDPCLRKVPSADPEVFFIIRGCKEIGVDYLLLDCTGMGKPPISKIDSYMGDFVRISSVCSKKDEVPVL
jgi:hypothetical protein